MDKLDEAGDHDRTFDEAAVLADMLAHPASKAITPIASIEADVFRA